MTASTRRDFLAQMAAIGFLAPMTGFLAGMRISRLSDQAVCVFSKHLQHLNYEELGEAAARIGFDGIDLTVRPGGHVQPEDAVQGIPAVVKAAKAAGVNVPMMTTAITSADDPLTEPILRTAAENGIKAYRLGYVRFKDTEPIEATLDGYRMQLEKLAELNSKYGLHGGYQNHAGTNVGGAVWDLWYIVKDLDPKWIGCQYDIRHAFVEGARAWPVGLRALKKFIRTCCIKDFRWDKTETGWQILNVPIGEGMVPFERYLDLWKMYGIDAFASMHFEYPMTPEGVEHTTPEGRQAIEKAMAKDLNTYREYLAAADART